jgi:hypothetical protein
MRMNYYQGHKNLDSPGYKGFANPESLFKESKRRGVGTFFLKMTLKSFF